MVYAAIYAHKPNLHLYTYRLTHLHNNIYVHSFYLRMHMMCIYEHEHLYIFTCIQWTYIEIFIHTYMLSCFHAENTYILCFIHADIDVLAKDHVDRFVPILGESETFESR